MMFPKALKNKEKNNIKKVEKGVDRSGKRCYTNGAVTEKRRKMKNFKKQIFKIIQKTA